MSTNFNSIKFTVHMNKFIFKKKKKKQWMNKPIKINRERLFNTFARVNLLPKILSPSLKRGGEKVGREAGSYRESGDMEREKPTL